MKSVLLGLAFLTSCIAASGAFAVPVPAGAELCLLQVAYVPTSRTCDSVTITCDGGSYDAPACLGGDFGATLGVGIRAMKNQGYTLMNCEFDRAPQSDPDSYQFCYFTSK